MIARQLDLDKSEREHPRRIGMPTDGGPPTLSIHLAPTAEAIAPNNSSFREFTRTFKMKVRRHWAILLVIGAFLATALWVPVLTPVATTDDWGYTRSVEILLDEHRLVVFPVVAATSVFQIFWGALFALFTDNSLGAVRVSTLVMSAIGAVALYGICRRLGVRRDLSALGAAAYLFNPLSFVLSYSFMTDPHFAAVMTVAAYCYLQGLGDRALHDTRWILAGSIAASAALLIRQQGVLIPLSVGLFLVMTMPLRPVRSLLTRLLAVGGIPMIGLGGYLIWLNWFNGVPDVQESFASEIQSAGIDGAFRLVSRLSYFELLYLGFFLLPVMIVAFSGIETALLHLHGWGWILFLGWTVATYVGIVFFADTRRRMPYIPQFMGSSGLGPPDVRGSRPRLFEQPTFDILTAVSAISTIMLALFLARAFCQTDFPHRRGAGLVAAIALGQVVGVIPPSYHYLNRGISLDRYLLPLLPLGISLGLWAVNPPRWSTVFGWAVIVLFAIFAMISTRDYLVYLDHVWAFADDTHESGIPLDEIDAGAAWDGYHLYTYGVDAGITRAKTRDGPWWTYFYGKATDSSYVVSGKRIKGYVIVATRSYPSTLQEKPTTLFLLRRVGVSPRWSYSIPRAT